MGLSMSVLKHKAPWIWCGEVGIAEAWGQATVFSTLISLVMGPAQPRLSLMCPDHLINSVSEGESDWMYLVYEDIPLNQEASFGEVGW